MEAKDIVKIQEKIQNISLADVKKRDLVMALRTLYISIGDIFAIIKLPYKVGEAINLMEEFQKNKNKQTLRRVKDWGKKNGL